MFLDLDHFKDVNDTLGHRVGDLLLKELARRIRAALRQSDVLARVSGDEFVVVLEDFPDEDAPERVARKILDEVRRPFHDRGPRDPRERQPRPRAPSRGRRRRRDAAQERRRGDVPREGAGAQRLPRCSRRSSRSGARDRMQVETALRRALRDDELRAALTSRSWTSPPARWARRGAAALARPRARPGAAGGFIPLAEEIGPRPCRSATGCWTNAAARRASGATRAGRHRRVREPLREPAARHRDGGGPEGDLRATGCEPGWLQFEITETSMVRDVEGASAGARASCARSACASRSTTSAPAFRASRTCATCRWTCSRSTRRSWPTSSATTRARRARRRAGVRRSSPP